MIIAIIIFSLIALVAVMYLGGYLQVDVKINNIIAFVVSKYKKLTSKE